MSYRVQKSILRLGLPLGKKLLSLLLAGICFLPIFLFGPIEIHPFAFFILSFIIIILMDLFAENVSGGLTWPFIWLTALSACTSLLVFNYSNLRVKNNQTELLESWMKSDTITQKTGTIFSWTQYHKDRTVFQKGPVKAMPGNLTIDIPQGKIKHFETDKAYYLAGKKSQSTYIIARDKPGINEPISLYALFFVLWVGISLILLFINRPLELLPRDWAFYWTELPSLRKRIQFYILAVTVGSFGAIAAVTYLYFEYQGQKQSEQLALRVTSATVRDFINSWREQPNIDLLELFNLVQAQHQTSGYLYRNDGIRISNKGAPLLPLSVQKTMYFSNQNIQTHNGKIFHKIPGPNNQSVIAQFDMAKESLSIGPAFKQIILTLLNIYVFLFVITGGIAVAISNSITAPLKVLSERLKSLKLGKKNVPLNWSQKDELGELISDYNRMILQLEESAKIMATTERETAWREMAKQVAHEIKNPLTPMKLSLQHLKFAIENDHPNKEKLFHKVSATLIEQIDNLNRIASEFSSFAKMPEPENKVVSLNEIVASIHDLFRERKDMDIQLFVPIDDLRVFADKDHLLRVMSNLIKNAVQAIPEDRRGQIIIRLYKEKDEAVIKVSDNGKGIPDEVKEKVFKPNFTSKSSGTGLGLAICANIIEGFNGKIYFDTEVNKGTDFYVIIPLMRTKENFHQHQRVPL
jgi:signal transduction histidine kinase